MRKKLFFLLFYMFIISMSVLSQTRTITGKVIEYGSNKPLPGVSVMVEGTTFGTATNVDGEYSLKITEDSRALIFTFIGMIKQRVEINNQSVINVKMKDSSIDVDEVVVTAMGISREKKGLTYAMESVSTKNMSKVQEGNFVNNLTGKVSGINITQSNGSIGASSRVILRGWSSVTGDNQPLFVIDGVPLDNTNFASSSSGWSRSGIDYGNAAMDINPNDVESISVLKGGSAAAMYGSRGANGVIIITTKSGKNAENKMGVSYSYSLSMANPLKLPDYQNKFGGGTRNHGLDWCLNGKIDEFGYKPTGYAVDESWGQPLDGTPDLHPITGKMVPMHSMPDSRKDFYDTGITHNNNISITGQDKKYSYRFSYTNIDQQGIMPTSEYKKNQFSFGGTYNPNEKLSISSNANLLLANAHNRDLQGQSDGSINLHFLWSCRNHDYGDWKNYRDDEGRVLPLHGSYFQDNVWFLLENNPNDDNRTRFFGNVKTSYKFIPELSIHGRIGIDTYRDERAQHNAFGGISTGRKHGGFVNYNLNNTQITADYFLKFRKIFDEKFDVSALVGHNVNQRKYYYTRLEAPELIAENIFSLDNAASINSRDHRSLRRLHGVYASLNLGYKDFLFLDLTARNDWSSTLPSDNNSYFYPSVGLGFVFTNALELNPNIINHGKIRLNYAQVGNDTDPYRIKPVYNRTNIHDGLSDNFQFPMNGVYGFSLENSRKNPKLKPELQTNYEIGIELGLLKNRIAIDFTYYNQSTEDQIIRHAVSTTTGYNTMYINAGEITNKGIETSLNLKPIKTSNFSWDIDLTYSANENEVVSLTPGVDAITLPGGFVNPSFQCRVGESYGVMYGKKWKRDPQGNYVVNSAGKRTIDPTLVKIGDPNPDWLGSIRNTFNYKNLSLSVLFDTKQGGDLYSLSVGLYQFTGQAEETLSAYGHDRYERFVIPNSVIQTAEGKFVKNTKTTTVQDYYRTGLFGCGESKVFDASYIKLREITLSYVLPDRLLKKTKYIHGADVFVSGRNLLLWTDMPHIDPEVDAGATTGNLHGYEYANSPSTRNFTFGVNLKF